jgi:hypothetical protein
VPKRCTLINVIIKCCTLSVLFYSSVWILASLRQGLHVVALLGLPPRCRESGFRPRKSDSFHIHYVVYHIPIVLSDLVLISTLRRECVSYDVIDDSRKNV